jgi:head-tail adaptor
MPRLTRRLAHEAPVDLPDGAGGWTRGWTELGAHWAELRMRSGRLREREFGHQPQCNLRIVIHAVPEGHAARPWPGHRLIDGARRYVVEAVHEARDPRFLTVLAREEVEA